MIEALSETYRSLAAEGMGVSPGRVSVMVFTRAPGEKHDVDLSIYLFFLPQEKYPSAVGKVGFNPTGRHFLEREHLGLQSLVPRLNRLPNASVPRPLLYREVAGRHLLLQSAVKGEKVSTWLVPGARPTRRCSRFLDWAADWCAALGHATWSESETLVPTWTEEFSTKLDRTGRSRPLLEKAAREVWENFGRRFPCVLAHGDFCGENILGDGDRYGVIDWEHWSEPSLPTYDILDLCLWMIFRTEGHPESEPFEALERLLNGVDPLAQELRRTLGRYAKNMGIRREVLPPLVALAWTGYCLDKYAYLGRDETGRFARARAGVRKILETPASVLAGERGAP